MAKQPNVLLICTDHWPGDLLGAAGHPAILTPTLDQLARNGVIFNRAYSACPICIPARRTLMTGTTPRTHGDRVYQEGLEMPALPTMAQAFRGAGYQTCAVGKLHVYPQRNRIGFDDVLLSEEGRVQWGVVDDYETYLGDRGHLGQAFAHGMCNNSYIHRPWHLPEDCHVTNWATRQMARVIKRRDPTRPAFWYLSYVHPHPPIAPLACYLDLYREVDPGLPCVGTWARDPDAMPYALRSRCMRHPDIPLSPEGLRAARRAFYALCTHIDHQLRLVIGTLREEGLLQNTILMFTSDHGDMLGNHGLWMSGYFLEASARIPLILVGTAADPRAGHAPIDSRLAGLQDIMPTLLDLAGIEIPPTVEGLALTGQDRRDIFYGEFGEDDEAARMVLNGQFKLIYYPAGNRFQLFDLRNDPRELTDLSPLDEYREVLQRLTCSLVQQLHGSDAVWVRDGRLTGLPDKPAAPRPNRGLGSQRGFH